MNQIARKLRDIVHVEERGQIAYECIFQKFIDELCHKCPDITDKTEIIHTEHFDVEIRTNSDERFPRRERIYLEEFSRNIDGILFTLFYAYDAYHDRFYANGGNRYENID